VNPLSQESKPVGSGPTAAGTSRKRTEKYSYHLATRKNVVDQLPATQLFRTSEKPVTVFAPQEPLTNRKILAALADDPDPAASLAGIRKLLVGPTRNLHDAMFEELVTILEEADRDVQHELHSLDDRCTSLMAESETIRGHTEKLSTYVRDEFARLEKDNQVKLSEMFMAIDSKIDKLAADFARQLELLKAAKLNDVKVDEPTAIAEIPPTPHVSLADRLRALRES
jgi:hypothetical protein